MNEQVPQKRAGVPTGVVGLVLTIIFCVGIVLFPGRDFSVLLGGVLAFAGLVISIVGIATGSGRAAGVVGILVFILGWAINTAVIGRL